MIKINTIINDSLKILHLQNWFDKTHRLFFKLRSWKMSFLSTRYLSVDRIQLAALYTVGWCKKLQYMRQNKFPRWAMAISNGSGLHIPRHVTLLHWKGVDRNAPALRQCIYILCMYPYATKKALYQHIPGTYRFGRKLSFLWPKLTSQTAADRQNSTLDDSHWSTSRYKRCLHSNLFQLCCCSLTVHLVSTFYSKFHCFSLLQQYLFTIL